MRFIRGKAHIKQILQRLYQYYPFSLSSIAAVLRCCFLRHITATNCYYAELRLIALTSVS